MPSILSSASEKLRELEEKHQLRELTMMHRHPAVTITRDGRKMVSFSCNDYLGFSHHQALKRAAKEAIDSYGTGAGASRLVSGNHPLYERLEVSLAEWKKTGGALVFGSGYLANLGIITSLVSKDDLVIGDKLIHACMIDGVKLSGARFYRFAHNQVESCRALLAAHRGKHRRCLILTEGVFSMDGDIAPLHALYELACEFDAMLVVDDAHALGVTHGGYGSPYLGESMVLMGTFSKAMGSYGGYVCASELLIRLITNTARSLIFSTALPPATIAASVAALELLKTDTSHHEKLISIMQVFSDKFGISAKTAIVPYIVGDNQTTLRYARTLEAKGFYVGAIRPPTVPSGTSRLRFTLSALHDASQIDDLYNAFHSLSEVAL